MEKILVFGHKNPDTDAICSSLVMADLQTKIRGEEVISCRLGNLNEETKYALNYFKVEEPKLIEKWYLERFESLLDTAFLDPKNYYYQFAIGDRQAALAMSRSVWKKEKKKNLEEFILPTRGRADIILHKQENHLIDRIYLRKH
mgnify:CR=1 FL=1